ncbi:hypothetical protein ABQ013_14840 [Xanthomonas citri pv. malvacearum]|nr:hypothetical protein [Xanthomonas citri]OOW89496.1 hypothetical protein Xvtf_09485 [Xanthomonas campestris pv. vitistrifoliae]AOL21456.1 hypothetical protein BGK55_02970 [Xanthomonas citri pv. malvacearum]ASN02887.1 hypothetical protein APY29_19385 [Xanthomonas citri pv. malvacearum]ASN11091.1 hypothetical protein APY30_19210 [Xanthomonas citri pv. malvacearum]ASY86876.1 hypothetical protein CIW71_20785 [Xanthomonas citri pv. malvacearum]
MGNAAAHGIADSVDHGDRGMGKQVAAATFGNLTPRRCLAGRAVAIAANQRPGAPRGNAVGGCHPRVIRPAQAGRSFLDR